MENILRSYNAEALCEIIIDTLKELRGSLQPVTPKALYKALSRKSEYMALRADKPDDSLDGSHVKTLKDFRLNILHEFEDKLPQEFLALASEIRELINKSNQVQQILAINDNILDIIRSATRMTSGELEQFTSLIKEIGKDLVEMETGLMSSFSCTREIFANNQFFSNTLAEDLADTTEAIHISKSLIELKGFVAAKISTIKEVLEKKRKYDNVQLKKATMEVKKLRQRVTGMKQEIVQVQKKARALEEETLLDPLTGAHNRRAFEKRIREEFARFEHKEEIFSMLMIDIDQFKSVNDRYGHWAGDRCLEELTKLIKQILRGTDFLARYGGEEFIAILPGTNEQGVRIVAERMRKLIERARFLYQEEEIPLTVSIGGTTAMASDKNTEVIFTRMDEALYEAKRSGRNKSVIL